MAIRIVTDSTASIPAETAQAFLLHGVGVPSIWLSLLLITFTFKLSRVGFLLLAHLALLRQSSTLKCEPATTLRVYCFAVSRLER